MTTHFDLKCQDFFPLRFLELSVENELKFRQKRKLNRPFVSLYLSQKRYNSNITSETIKNSDSIFIRKLFLGNKINILL